MALVTTPGSLTADSYATLAEANTYHTAQGNTAWTGADALKEGALRRATVWLDSTYRVRFPGYRTDRRLQALEWPRTSAYDAAQQLLGVAEIPIEIKNAQIEAALRELATPGSLSPDFVATGQLKAISVEGAVSQEFFGISGASDVLPVVNIVDGILSGLIGGDANFVMRA